MKKQLSKVLMVLITILMVFSLLPAQFASATEQGNLSDYSHYGTEAELATYVNQGDSSVGWKGHVFKLEGAPDEDKEYYDYKLSVGVYNISQASMFYTSWKYDSDVVDLLDYEYKDTPFAGGSSDGYFEYSNLDSSMTNMANCSRYTITRLYDWSQEYEHTIVQESDSSYFDVQAFFTVKQQGLTESDWTTDDGAELSRLGVDLAYKYPKDKFYAFYTMYFKLKDPTNKPITSSTFNLRYHPVGEFHGGTAANILSTTEYVDEGVFLIGFQEPEKEPGTIKFNKIQNNENTAISGATVTLYTDSALSTVATAKDGATELTGTTSADGSITFENVPSGKSYYYKVTANNYADASGTTDSVSEGGISTVDAITLTEKAAVPYDLTVTVKNADTDGVIEGATVTVSSTPQTEGTTGATGAATIPIKQGTYSVTASMTGYQTNTVNDVEVAEGSGGSVEIKLVPERAKVTLPTLKDSEGNTLSDVKFTVTKTSAEATAEWGTSNTYAAGTEIEIPKNATFKVETVSSDYSKVTLYIQSDSSGVAKVFTDSTFDNEQSGDLTLEKMGDPVYKVVVEPDGVGSTTYTATVTLKNIDADYGTFGLRYDKDLFTLQENGFALDTNLELFDPNASAVLIDLETTNGPDDTIGYHAFTWGAQAGTSLNTLTEEKPIATYKFTLNGTADQINADSFSVMPYDKTENGRKYLESATGNEEDDKEITDFFLSRFWRYVDEDNQVPLEGRLTEDKAIDRGFYQAFAVSVLSNEDVEPGSMVDVKTEFEFESSLAGLVFEVVDEEGKVIPNVEITLSDKDGNKLENPLKTDSTGIAKTNVDVSNGDVTYTYTVNCDGYWETPVGAESPVGTVIVKKADNSIEFVYLTLEEKIYHKTVLKDTDNIVVDVNKAEISGDEYAYNNRDYHFNIEPQPGYKFNDEKGITAVINGEEYPVEFSKADNMYVIPANQITGEKTGEANENGFPSDDIIIKIAPDSIVETDAVYTATALAGTNGTVTYPAEVVDNVERTDNKVVVSNIPETGSTQDFTFTAEPGYYIERVVINGAEILGYTEKRDTELTYKFENITEDCSIAVTFWNGETPSTDSVVTLVVGDRGKANVTAPEETTVTNERRTFIYNAAGSLTFTTQADEGYELNAVEKEVNDGAKENITNDPKTNTSYDISIGVSENVVVYVTFKDPLAEDTFNVFVTAYVDCGEGTISPVGVLTYIKYERPKFNMKAKDSDWMLTAVKIDNEKQRYDQQEKDDEQLSEGTYQFESLTEDRSIGAMFTETAYNVYGLVDLSQNKTLYKDAPKNGGAKLTFTREDDPETPEDETMVVITDSASLRTNAPFNAELAKGTWKVVVTKQGYLNYTITDFVVSPSDTDISFGAKTAGDPAKPIVLLIGNTSGKGTVVSLEDAGVIGSAMRTGVDENIHQTLFRKGDVDDDGYVGADSDMAYVKENFGKRRIIQTYKEFVNGQ